MKKGYFVVSIDYEGYWGIHDSQELGKCSTKIKNGFQGIPKTLSLFEKYDIHATWAIVGALFLNDKKELISNLPEHLPNYQNKFRSPVSRIEEFDDSVIFNYENIQEIAKSKNQEIATHTFLHYYCDEPGASPFDFESDLLQAVKIAKQRHIEIQSIVFPRNQVNSSYLEVLKRNQINIYRGNEKNWINNIRISKLKRLLRLINNYINIAGNDKINLSELYENGLYNIRSSRFMRPYNHKFRCFEKMKIKRYKSEMLRSAKYGGIYHIYWHPHNFGTNQTENLKQLEDLFKFYLELKSKFGFESKNMSEIQEIVRSGD